MIIIKLTDIGPQGPPGPISTSGMSKEVYDQNDNGVVDNSEKLEGHPSSYFMEKVFVSEYGCFEVIT